MIRWLYLHRPSTDSFLSVEMQVPVSTIEIAERWANYRYPNWQVVAASNIYLGDE